MKPFKFLVVGVFLGCMLLVGGCSDDAARNIGVIKDRVDQIETLIAVYDEKVEVADGVIAKVQAMLADPNLGIPAREEMQVAIEKAVAVKIKFETAKGIATEQIQAIRATIAELEADGIQPGEDLIAFGEGLKSTGRALPSPVGPILLLIGAIIGGIGEARARASKKVSRGVIASVEDVLNNATAKDEETMKATLKFRQRKRGVRAGVKKLLDT